MVTLGWWLKVGDFWRFNDIPDSWHISGVGPRPANNRQVSAKKKIQPANN